MSLRWGRFVWFFIRLRIRFFFIFFIVSWGQGCHLHHPFYLFFQIFKLKLSVWLCLLSVGIWRHSIYIFRVYWQFFRNIVRAHLARAVFLSKFVYILTVYCHFSLSVSSPHIQWWILSCRFGFLSKLVQIHRFSFLVSSHAYMLSLLISELDLYLIAL